MNTVIIIVMSAMPAVVCGHHAFHFCAQAGTDNDRQLASNINELLLIGQAQSPSDRPTNWPSIETKKCALTTQLV